jgi:hypothetical protein
MAVHSFKARKQSLGAGPCADCGYTKGNEQQHGHSCTGKVIFDLMHCYECGKTYRYGGLALVKR